MPLSFDAIASQFDHQRALPRVALRAWVELIDTLADGSVLRIIEPGIGTGRIALPLCAMGHTVVGTDISQPMLHACETSAFSHGLTEAVTIVEADAIDLPYDDHQFDLGLIAQLLYLLPDWPSVLDELARVVKPGGYVIHLTEPTIESEALNAWSTRWRAAIESTGYQHITLSPSDDEVHAEFLRRWPDVRIQQLASWSFGQTVSEALDGYAARMRPLYATVPDVAFDLAVSSFLSWARDTFPNEDTRLDGIVTLTAMIAAV